MTISFKETPEFSKDYKHYLKKYKTLDGDFLNLKKIILTFPCGTGKHFNVITIINEFTIIKARFFCRCLKRSSLRIIYVYDKKQNIVDFLEIYFKGDKENEERVRIKEYLKSKCDYGKQQF